MWILHLSFHTVIVRTCCSLSGERCTHAAGVLRYHFNIVGGSRQQVVQSIRSHIAHKEVNGLVCACNNKEQDWIMQHCVHSVSKNLKSFHWQKTKTTCLQRDEKPFANGSRFQEQSFLFSSQYEWKIRLKRLLTSYFTKQWKYKWHLWTTTVFNI